MLMKILLKKILKINKLKARKKKNNYFQIRFLRKKKRKEQNANGNAEFLTFLVFFSFLHFL